MELKWSEVGWSGVDRVRTERTVDFISVIQAIIDEVTDVPWHNALTIRTSELTHRTCYRKE